MFVHKLRVGVLHLSTPDGLLCIPLNRSERLLLLWVFRHFTVLPETVLGSRSHRLLNQLRNGDTPYQRCASLHPADREAVIGTVECSTPTKKPPRSASDWVRPQVSVLRATASKN